LHGFCLAVQIRKIRSAALAERQPNALLRLTILDALEDANYWQKAVQLLCYVCTFQWGC
jgi:hypothetical protein